MVDRIGTQGSSLARAAIEAALRRQTEALQRMERAASAQDPSQIAAATQGLGSAAPAQRSEFASALVDGLRSVDAEVKKADALVEDVVAGRVTDFSEVAAQLKQSDLSLKFALEVRNKFVDAYREVMRMSV